MRAIGPWIAAAVVMVACGGNKPPAPRLAPARSATAEDLIRRIASGDALPDEYIDRTRGVVHVLHKVPPGPHGGDERPDQAVHLCGQELEAKLDELRHDVADGVEQAADMGTFECSDGPDAGCVAPGMHSVPEIHIKLAR